MSTVPCASYLTEAYESLQARQMGTYAAHCMLGEEDQFGSDLSLELFTHVTRFFGLKVHGGDRLLISIKCLH